MKKFLYVANQIDCCYNKLKVRNLLSFSISKNTVKNTVINFNIPYLYQQHVAETFKAITCLTHIIGHYKSSARITI